MGRVPDAPFALSTAALCHRAVGNVPDEGAWLGPATLLSSHDRGGSEPTHVTRQLPNIRILVVDERDVGLSPATALLLQRALTPSAAVQVGSAGLVAPTGRPMLAPVARWLTAAGLRPEVHRSRPLTPDLSADADLILTGDRAGVTAVLVRDAAALNRTFTVRGLTRVVTALQATPLSSSDWLAKVQWARGRSVPVHVPGDDLPVLDSANNRTIARVLGEVDKACWTIARSYTAREPRDVRGLG